MNTCTRLVSDIHQSQLLPEQCPLLDLKWQSGILCAVKSPPLPVSCVTWMQRGTANAQTPSKPGIKMCLVSIYDFGISARLPCPRWDPITQSSSRHILLSLVSVQKSQKKREVDEWKELAADREAVFFLSFFVFSIGFVFTPSTGNLNNMRTEERTASCVYWLTAATPLVWNSLAILYFHPSPLHLSSMWSQCVLGQLWRWFGQSVNHPKHILMPVVNWGNRLTVRSCPNQEASASENGSREST